MELKQSKHILIETYVKNMSCDMMSISVQAEIVIKILNKQYRLTLRHHKKKYVFKNIAFNNEKGQQQQKCDKNNNNNKKVSLD